MDFPITKQPYIPECEVFYKGESDSGAFYDSCEKNSGHLTFISVDKLKKEHLPLGFQDKRYINNIRHWCDRTVKILVNITSLNRPDTYWNSDVPYPYSEIKGSKRAQRSGTGFVKEIIVPRKGTPPCPCHLCQECTQPESDYWQVEVHTATHVIYDDKEAFSALFECFYDSEDRKGVKYLYGVDVKNPKERRYFSDVCVVNCVTHDESLVKRFCRIPTLYNILANSYLPSPEWGFIISHPHGCSKKITIGKIISYSFPQNSKFDKSKPHNFGRLERLRLPSQKHNLVNGFLNHLSRLLPFCVRLGGDDNDSSVPSVLDPNTMVSGKEYLIPEGMTYTLPLDSEYYCRAKCIRPELWTTFPPGTIFTLEDGTDVSLPPDTEFYLIGLNGNHLKGFVSYMIYNIDTCRGSSGAPVFTYVEDLGDRFQLHAITHHGALEDKTNCSGSDTVCGYIFSMPR